LIKGSNGLTDYTEENLLNPEIKAIAGRVRVEVDKEMTSLFPSKIGARLTVKLKNGISYQEKVYDAGGTPANPASAKELQDKFRDLSSVVFPADRSNKIIEVVYDLENIKEISTLACLLRQ
jgi:2-methylcitrate dehydratase PrpD